MKKAKVIKSAGKIPATAFSEGVIFIDYLEKGKTIYYAKLLGQLETASIKAMVKLDELHYELDPHRLYSPCDLYMFPNLNK